MHIHKYSIFAREKVHSLKKCEMTLLGAGGSLYLMNHDASPLYKKSSP
jgi:hypothetical protein